MDSVTEIRVTSARVAQKEFFLKQSEVTQLRSIIGQVQWATNQTRPDVSYHARNYCRYCHKGTKGERPTSSKQSGHKVENETELHPVSSSGRARRLRLKV